MKEKSSHTLKDIYRFFVNTYKSKLDLAAYKYIQSRFNDRIVERMFKGEVITLPCDIGTLQVLQYNLDLKFNNEGNFDLFKSRVSINWKETNELWNKYPDLYKKKFIIHDNEHTNGNVYRVAWYRVGVKIRNMHKFKFKVVRRINRNLAQHIKNTNNVSYYQKANKL